MSRRAKLIIWPLSAMLVAAALYRWIPQLESGRLADQLRERGGRFDQNEAGDILWLKLPPETNDDDLLVLRESTELRQLDLSGTRVTDAGLRNLGRLPRLTALNLSDTPAISNGFASSANWPALNELRARGNAWVTDEQVGHLTECPQLASIDLSGTPITDQGVETLCALPDLHWWTLRDCEQVTDRSLELLDSRAGLQGAVLDQTSVTWAAWSAARERRPDVFKESNPLLFSDFRLLREGGAEYSGTSGAMSLQLEQDVPAEAFAQLRLLPPLHVLKIRSSTLTDDDIRPCLENSPELLALDVSGSSITGLTITAAANYCSRLGSINVANTDVTAADMHAITEIDSLGWLDLQRLDLAGADLRDWDRLTMLTLIRFDDSTIDDVAMQSLPPLPQLEFLTLDRTNVTADGLPLLARHPSLAYLDIENIPLSESAMQALATLPLQHLSAGPGLNGLLINFLQDSEIYGLRIRDPQLTDDDVAAMSRLPRLSTLELRGTVPAPTLRAIAGLEQLKSLHLEDAVIEKTAVTELRTLRPDVFVFDSESTSLVP